MSISAIKAPAAGVRAAWRRFGGVLCTLHVAFSGFPPGTQQKATSIGATGGKCRDRTLSNEPWEKAVLLKYHRARKWGPKNSSSTTSRFRSKPPVLRGTGRPHGAFWKNSAVTETTGTCWIEKKGSGGPWVHVDSSGRQIRTRGCFDSTGPGPIQYKSCSRIEQPASMPRYLTTARHER